MKKKADLTSIFAKAGLGDAEAQASIWPEVYQELHKMASIYLSKSRRSETMRPTVMVNEAYLKLLSANQGKFENRVHFFAVSAIVMRQILVDYYRSKGRKKRGGNEIILSFDENAHQTEYEGTTVDLEALNQALTKLEQEDAQMAKVVELKFFGGLELKEIADYLKISLATVKRRWQVAKLWLYHELTETEEKQSKAG